MPTSQEQFTAKMNALADAINTKCGTTGTMTIDEMKTAVDAIPTGGGEKMDVSWHQCPEAVRNYLANVTYDPSDYSTSQIANYAPATAVVSNTKPIGETVDGVTYYNEVPSEQTPFASANVAGTLTPLDYLRWLNTNASNVRDLGGWPCDGGTVKYGLLIRGGLPSIQDRNVLVEECGVRHELDLRGTEEAQGRTTSILGSDVGYSVFDNYAWYSLDAVVFQEMLGVVFRCVKYNEPIYFHCSAGADRTGTLACIIEALLGVSQSDCDKDYELTSFATGTETGSEMRARNETDWTGLIFQINQQTGSTFRDKVVSFVRKIGFSIEEINDFRASMIDGNPEVLTDTLDTYSVSNSLTNVTSDNDATTIKKYLPYDAEITPDVGCTIDSVVITMDGVDITDTAWQGELVYYTYEVSPSLTNCSSNNQATDVLAGSSYAATITPSAGYTLVGATVVITMGGADASSYYSNGVIAIPEVTGNLSITITAVAA